MARNGDRIAYWRRSPSALPQAKPAMPGCHAPCVIILPIIRGKRDTAQRRTAPAPPGYHRQRQRGPTPQLEAHHARRGQHRGWRCPTLHCAIDTRARPCQRRLLPEHPINSTPSREVGSSKRSRQQLRRNYRLCVKDIRRSGRYYQHQRGKSPPRVRLSVKAMAPPDRPESRPVGVTA